MKWKTRNWSNCMSGSTSVSRPQHWISRSVKEFCCLLQVQRDPGLVLPSVVVAQWNNRCHY
jgi:hypothetical protein